MDGAARRRAVASPSVGLAEIAFPLRHGRPYGAGAASFTFLMTGGEFWAVLYGTSAATGQPLPMVGMVDVAMTAAFLVATAAAAVMFFATRGRSREVWRPVEFTELLDVETLKLRAYVSDRAEEEPQRPVSRTRQILDTYRNYGAAGASARRG